MLFIDKLYSNYGFGRIQWDGFADGGVRALTNGFADEAEGKV
jgi:hypothetical protein